MNNINSMSAPPHTCECGNYEPKVTEGVPDDNCKNCDGTKPIAVFGPDSCVYQNESL